MDPLSLLREHVSSSRIDQVVLAGDRIDFGGRYSFPKAAPTSYKSQQSKGDFYDLESLLFFAQSLGPTFKFTDYFKKARKAGLTQVTYLDRTVSERWEAGRAPLG